MNDRSRDPDAGKQVEIISRSNKHRREIGVIIDATPKTYIVRLSKKIPTIDRLVFSGGVVNGTRSANPHISVSKSSIRFTGKRQQAPQMNDWHKDTSDLLDQTSGKTLSQIKQLLR